MAAVVIAWAVTRVLILLWARIEDPAARTDFFAQFLPTFGGDLRFFFEWSGSVLEGRVPYRDLAIQYPPGAVVLFAIPRLFATTFDGYATAFALEMMVLEGLALLLVWRLPALILGRERAGEAQVRSARVMAALTYLGLTAVLGRLLLRRFDVAVGMLVVAFVHSVLSGRRPLRAELILALGIWIKLTPAALVPLYLVMLHRRQAAATPFARWLVTAGWRPAARIAVFVAALMAPFVVLARGAFWHIFRYQADRGLHLESLPASLLVFVQSLHGIGVTRGEAHGAVEVFHPWAPAFTALSDVAVVAAVLAIAGLCGRRLRQAPSPVDEREIFVAGTVATLLSVMSLSKLFSPQYVLWIAALLPLTQLRVARRSVVVAAMAVFTLTGYLFLFDYSRLTNMGRLPATMLLVRNFTLLWLVWQLAAHPAAGTERDQRRARVVTVVVALAVAAWIVVTNVTPLHDGELWSDLRIGREILTHRVFPRTDTFTATGAGEPIVLPGWLSGVSFYAFLRATHAWALCLLQPAVAGGCALLLLFSLRREERRSGAVVPFLLLAMHVIASHTDVRHQMFSPLAVAAVGFALQRWRRSGRARDLAWLVPMQLLWANLNGEALAAPLLVALLALVVGVAARLGGGKVPDGDRVLDGRDARVLGVLAAAMFLATLCNPYGLGRALWSPGWEDGDGQWSLAPAVIHRYSAWSCAALALATWLALALRWSRRRPMLDIAIVAFATFMSLRAFRFIPYVAILGFPIVVHSIRELAADFLARSAPRRWLGLELGISVAVLAVAVVDGYSFNAWANRPPGVGVARHLPLEEVKLVKQSGLRGAMFNDRASGGLISFSLAPHVQPVIDARPDTNGSARWAEYQRARSSRGEFLAYLERYDVRFVLLHVEPTNVPMLRTLATEADWTLVSDTASYGLYVRKTAEPANASP